MSLWNNIQVNDETRSPLNCTRTDFSFNQETSLGICHKASLTIEATVIIPLVTAFFVTILFFFRVLQIQVAVDEALVYAGRLTSVSSSIFSSDEEIFLFVESVMHSTLQGNDVVEEYIRGGIWGISLLDSRIGEESIWLKAKYEVGLPISFFGRQTLSLYSQNLFYKWNGNLNSQKDSSWVYITQNGEVYHATESCRVLDLSIKESTKGQIVNLRGKDGQKFYPCSACKAKKSTSKVVYYTDYGRLYHADLSCSALKRTIIRISISDVEEREACSYCYSK